MVDGARSIGDSYLPTLGNGGYDVENYDLELSYDPAPNLIDATVTVRMRTDRDLASFSLDFTPSTRRRRASRLRNRCLAAACRRRNSTACYLPRAPLSLPTPPARPCGRKRAPLQVLRPARVPAVPQRSPR